jgi:hypothetical protein
MIQLPASLNSYRDKVDGSATLSFSTRELTDDEIIILRNSRLKEGWLLFKENAFSENEIPEEEAPVEGKSASQRLYNVMFKIWKQNHIGNDFEGWRRIEMEKLINHYKNKIDG